MKSSFSLMILFCLVQVARAQKLGIGLQEHELKGRVKELTMSIFSNAKTLEDTIQKPEKIAVKFDEKGNVISETDFGSDGKITHKFVYLYTSKNTIIVKHFGFRGDFIERTTTKYDDKGHKIESDNSPVFSAPTKSVFINDKDGNVIERDDYMDKVLKDKTIMKYNEKGQMISAGSYSADGVPNITDSVKYDTLKNSIQHTEYLDGGLTLKRNIVDRNNDQFGNWTLRTIETQKFSAYELNNSNTIIKRSISYY
ncbi:MAG: hypothetical protein JSU01_02330 [Bacteroidetes bacterium]|nr:hypothetical protein [Bacteroidota bacterium]